MAGLAAKEIVRLDSRRPSLAAPHDDWSTVAEAAIHAEAQRRGLGKSYDAEADEAGICEALITALQRWRGHVPGEVAAAAPDMNPSAAPAGVRATLTARLRCPACRGGDIFILTLSSGHLVPLNGDLTYTCASEEEADAMPVFCGSCAHTAPALDYRGDAVASGGAAIGAPQTGSK